MGRSIARPSRPSGFTLLEVVLIVAIIGMMMLIIVGYLISPKHQAGPLPPIKISPTPTTAPVTPFNPLRVMPSALTPIPSGPSTAPSLSTPAPPPAPDAPAAASTDTPAATPATGKTIDLSGAAPPPIYR